MDRRFTRRQMMAALAAGSMAVRPRPSFAAASPPPSPRARRWGVQLYTVRTQIESAPAATLERIAEIGFTELEVLQPTLATVAPMVAPLGLTIVSVHLDAPTAKGDGFDALLADAKRLGLRYVVVPFVPPAERPLDRAGFEALAARLSTMARAASAAGLQLCYHNHAFEFGPDGTGSCWLDVLMRGTAAAGMQLELDVFWAAFAGADPVALLRQYQGRVALMHLKDKDSKTRGGLVETAASPTDFVEVGSGALDFRAILSAARGAGVRHYFVEQDATPGDPVESLEKSYAYLAGMR
jgi:sugar phosphate isomerase/epimerase